jgi:hypothetical protein
LKPETRRKITKSSQEGLREGWTRATFIVREDQLEKLKAVAIREGKRIRDTVEEALKGYLKDKETKGN